MLTNCIGYLNRKIFILIIFYGDLATFIGFIIGMLSVKDIYSQIIVI